MLETLSAADFTPHVGTSFEIDQLEGKSIELISVEKKENIPGQEIFSLVFGVPPDEPLSQATYELTHPVLGKGELFLVPIAQKDGLLHYEAAFNRLTNNA